MVSWYFACRSRLLAKTVLMAAMGVMWRGATRVCLYVFTELTCAYVSVGGRSGVLIRV